VNIWLTMLLGGLITFGLRFSLIYLFGRFEIPRVLRGALRFVPPAVFSAIVVPELFAHVTGAAVHLESDRLMAGTVAILIARLTRSTLWTIAVGMATLVLAQWLG
jgi:branched-subunit amino acid transport protein